MNLNATLFVQCIVFFVLALFTMRYIWPPLIQALDERTKKIAEGLAAAEKAKHELSQASLLSEDLLNKARADALLMVTQAEEKAAIHIKNAQKESGKILADARLNAEKEIDALVIKAQQELKVHLASLVISATEKVLSREVKLADHQKFLSDVEHRLNDRLR